MIRIFYNNPLLESKNVHLDKKQSHYLYNVMRKRATDRILIFNNENGEFEAEIKTITKKEAHLELLRLVNSPAKPSDCIILFAPIKRLDYMAQKATEMGAKTIQPAITYYTNIRQSKHDKIIANCIEAAEQCERVHVPEVLPEKRLDSILGEWDTERVLFFGDESGNGKLIDDAITNTPKKWGVLIGPEGGFSEEELALLHKLPFTKAISLGKRILRADTALVALMTLLQNKFGDWKE